MLGHLQRTPATPTEVNAVIPPAVSQAVMRALSKKPQERFATAAEFQSSLEGLSPGREQTLPQKDLSLPMAGPATGTSPAAPGTRPVPSVANPAPDVQKPASSAAAASLPLEELTRQLAVYIGPVAKFVVKKLAAQYSDLDQLYLQVAKQIPSEADREKFLRSRRRQG
jgi:serine/threonine-protein kinase